MENKTKINNLIQDNKLHIKQGFNTNYYLFSKDINKLKQACAILGRSESAIYYRKKYQCYAIRFKLKSMKQKIKNLKLELLKINENN